MPSIIEPLSKSKYAFCFISDDFYAPHLSISLISLSTIAYNDKKNFYDIAILSNNIKQCHKTKLSSIFLPNKNVSIRFYDISTYINKGILKSHHGIGVTTYARFLIPSMFKKYKKVLYLDSDVLLINSPFGLFNKDMNKKSIGAVRDTAMGCWCCDPHKFGAINRKYLERVIKLDSPFDYFNAGVILYDISLCSKDKDATSKLFNFATEKKWKWMDQDILNYYYKNKVYYFSSKWNLMVHEVKDNDFQERVLPNNIKKDFLSAFKSPSILHYAGMQQPIYRQNVPFSKKYLRCLNQSPFKSYILESASSFRNRNESYFLRLAKKIFPKDTTRGVIARYFYYSFKR